MSANFCCLLFNESYQHARILVPAHIEVAEFSTLQIPKTLVNNPNDFPSIGRILEAMLSLVSVSNPMLIRYQELFLDVSQGATPNETKKKLKGVIIKEPVADAQPQKK